MHEYVIIGAGISGVAFARLLQMSGVTSFVILEQEDEPGGLCRTKQIGEHVLDIGGGHFLCSKHAEVYEFIFAHIPRREFADLQRVSTVRLGEIEVDYPLESNLWQLPATERVEYLISAIQNGEARGLPQPKDFEAWIRWKLGERIADSYMVPYNAKIWGIHPAQMDVDWLHKIPRLHLREIVTSCLERNGGRDKMPSHASFLYPRQGGFQRIYDAIMQPVREQVQVRTRVSAIERDGDWLVVNGQYRTRRVVNTAPWHALAGSPVFTAAIRQAIASLRHSAVVVSLHEEEYRTNAHWTYIPSYEVPHHRAFFIHNFAPHSSPRGLYRETNALRWRCGTGEVYSHLNSYAYPIPTIGWAKAIREVRQHAELHNVYGLGRWGQWEYLNSDVCVQQAMALADRLGHATWRNHLAPVA